MLCASIVIALISAGSLLESKLPLALTFTSSILTLVLWIILVLFTIPVPLAKAAPALRELYPSSVSKNSITLLLSASTSKRLLVVICNLLPGFAFLEPIFTLTLEVILVLLSLPSPLARPAPAEIFSWLLSSLCAALIVKDFALIVPVDPTFTLVSLFKSILVTVTAPSITPPAPASAFTLPITSE